MPKAKTSGLGRVRRASATTPARSRSFDGCATCRRRHVKCDNVRPACFTCKAVGLECEGFVPDLRWIASTAAPGQVDQQPDDASAGTVRRPLYTEQVRARMSATLTADLAAHESVDTCLAALEAQASIQHQTNVGPFSVINPGLASASPKHLKRQTAQEESLWTVDNELPNQVAGTADRVPQDFLIAQNSATLLAVEQNVVESFSTWQDNGPSPSFSLSDGLQWDDLFQLGSGELSDPFYRALNPLLGLESQPVIVSDSDNGLLADANDRANGAHQNPVTLPSDLIVQASVAPEAGDVAPLETTCTASDVLSIAPVLLKHFRDHVVQHISALPIVSKSPWSRVNLVAAVDTHAQLTLLSNLQVSSAKQSGLYGLLAMSACHLSRNPAFHLHISRSHGKWADIALAAKQKATNCLEWAFTQEMSGPRKAKYKDLLMATQCMIALSVMSGAQRDVRCYMLDAERLLRVRGLAKREVSRKCRLLHHMYTWNRIVAESTYVLHDYDTLLRQVELRTDQQEREVEHHVGALSTSERQQTKLDNFLRFDAAYRDNEPDKSDGDVDAAEPKEVYIKDIHLEDSRDNPNTMYGMIYGISETWLRLLSQTTRLANYLDAIRATGQGSGSESLERRATKLEDLVCSFAASSSASSTSLIATDHAAQNHHLHQALNSALVIFFYRRIRRVNSWILQTYVDRVVQALSDFDQVLAEQQLDYAGTVWPAFIAGCEAVAPAARKQLIAWVERAEAKTGLYSYTNAREILLKLWSTKPVGMSVPRSNAQTWMDLLRRENLWLVAS